LSLTNIYAIHWQVSVIYIANVWGDIPLMLYRQSYNETQIDAYTNTPGNAYSSAQTKTFTLT